MMKTLAYEIGRGPVGPNRKRWDRIVCRAHRWDGPGGTYAVQNKIIANAESGKYRPGHVVIIPSVGK